MKVTPAMYGRAAKCVACHQKWFVPTKEEVPAPGGVLELKEHPELLRKTGIFARADARKKPLKNFSVSLEKSFDPTPIMDSDGGISSSGEDISDEAYSEDESQNDKTPSRHKEKQFTDRLISDDSLANADPVLAPVRSKGKKPLDILEPLRLLCSYHYAVEKMKRKVRSGNEHFIDNGVLAAYQRTIEDLWAKLNKRLQRGHKSTQKQIAGIEGEIARLAVALRVGDIALPHFLEQSAELRSMRERLVRLDHNFQAWQHLKDPYLAGGLLDVSLDELDADAFPIELPQEASCELSGEVYSFYSEELRDALQSRAHVERHMEGAKQERFSEELEERPFIREDLLDARASLERTEARIVFFRERLEHLLSDCDHDLRSLHKYRLDVEERDKKDQLRQSTRAALIKEIDKAEFDIRRIQNHIHKTLAANSPQEVSIPPDSFMDRRNPYVSKRMAGVSLLAYLAAALLLIPGLLLLSYREAVGVDRIVFLPLLVILLQPLLFLYKGRWPRFVVLVFLWLLQCALVLSVFYVFSLHVPMSMGKPFFFVFDILGTVLITGSVLTGLAAGASIMDERDLSASTGLFIALLCGIASGVVVAAAYDQAQPARMDLFSAGTPVEQSFMVGEQDGLESPHSPAFPDAPNDSTVFLAEVGADTLLEEAISTDTDTQREAVLTDDDMEELTADMTSVDELMEGRVSLTMVGVVHGEDIAPRFRASLTYFDGHEETLTLQLGDTIVGAWKAREYNAESKKLTITNGERLLLIGAGERLLIDDTPENGDPDNPR